MPYYVHPKATIASTDHPCYTSAADAHTQRRDGEVVTFIASDDESSDWRTREHARFASNEYWQAPWCQSNEQWFYNAPGRWSHATGHPYPLHFEHLSLKHKGMIAYTPSEEYGVQDRQIVMKPGRYLERFKDYGFDSAAIKRYIEMCQGDLQIAYTPDDIVRVYMGGPSSCMDRGHWEDGDMKTPIHPVSIYGDSDLALAYTGSIDRARSRCLIWPDRKIRGRLYGETCQLLALLHEAGYSEGNFDGAKIRAIRVGHNSKGYVMPYVDWCESAELVDNGTSFMLHNDDEAGYRTQSTNGCTHDADAHGQYALDRCTEDDTEDEDDLPVCEHCRESYDNDEYAPYCCSCGEDRWVCDSCGDESWDQATYDYVGEQTVCQACLPAEVTCRCCNRSWREVTTFSRANHQQRAADHVDDLCNLCAADYWYCHHCQPVDTFWQWDDDDQTATPYLTTRPHLNHTSEACVCGRLQSRRCERTRDLFTLGFDNVNPLSLHSRVPREPNVSQPEDLSCATPF